MFHWVCGLCFHDLAFHRRFRFEVLWTPVSCCGSWVKGFTVGVLSLIWGPKPGTLSDVAFSKEPPAGDSGSIEGKHILQGSD